jgi:uncharacterized short protein YbdD (DUF466 family)
VFRVEPLQKAQAVPGLGLRVFGGWLRHLWQSLRRLSGDDAYERYLAHWQAQHSHDSSSSPLSRQVFFRHEQERHWNSGIKRCC